MVTRLGDGPAADPPQLIVFHFLPLPSLSISLLLWEGLGIAWSWWCGTVWCGDVKWCGVVWCWCEGVVCVVYGVARRVVM